MPNSKWKKKFTSIINDQLHAIDRKLWAKRLFVYFVVLWFVLFLCTHLFNCFNLYQTDVNSARYMLSAMVQAQAAVIVIVMTLTFIAVQLTASIYSPRMINLLKKNPDMWILLGVYVVSISYGFIILKMVEGMEGDTVNQDIIWSFGRVSLSSEFFVSFAYWLEIFTLVALFPYMLNIINLLKPEKIIEKLMMNITKDNLLNPEEDPIQPVMDIAHRSIVKNNDIVTTKFIIVAVAKKVLKIIKSNDFDSDGDEKLISERFCGNFEHVCRSVVSRADDSLATDVIFCLCKFTHVTVKKKLEIAAKEGDKTLTNVGILVAKKEFPSAKQQVHNCLNELEKLITGDHEKELGEFVERKNRSFIGKMSDLSEHRAHLAKVVVEGGEEDDIYAYKMIESVIRCAASIIMCVESIAKEVDTNGEDINTKEYVEVIYVILEHIGLIGRTAAEKKFCTSAECVAKNLAFFGTFGIQSDKEITKMGICFLKEIGMEAAEKGKELEPVIKETAKSLGIIGSATGKESEDETTQIAQAFIDIGVITKKNELDHAARMVAKSFATLPNKKIINGVIQKNQSELQECHEYFKTFIELYEECSKNCEPDALSNF